MPKSIQISEERYERMNEAAQRVGFDLSRRGPGGQMGEFLDRLIEDAEHYRHLISEWNALVNGLQALGFRVWSGDDESGWVFQWDGGKRVSGFASDGEAIIAAVKSKLRRA